LVIFDLLLTYIGTPDLKYESNWIIKTLNMSWPEIVCGASLIVLVTIILIFKAENVFVESDCQKQILSNLREFLLCVVVIFFYSHFIYSIYVVINNCLSAIYLHGKNDFVLKEFALKYVHFYQKNASWYNIFTHFISFLLGLIVTVLRLYKIKFTSNMLCKSKQ
jgi:hypothetical protein